MKKKIAKFIKWFIDIGLSENNFVNILLLILFFFAMIPNTNAGFNWVLNKSYTFDSGSDNGFTKHYTTGGDGVYTGNDFHRGTAQTAESIAFNNSRKAINITFDYIVDDVNGIYAGVGFDNSASSTFVYEWSAMVHEDNDAVYFFNVDNSYDDNPGSTAMIIGIGTYKVNWIILTNQTEMLYVDGSLKIADSTRPANINSQNRFVIFASGADDNIDNIKIYLNQSAAAPPPPASNQTPTPAGTLKVIWKSNNTATLSSTDSCHTRCLLYRNSTNVLNFTTFPINNTGLSNNTRYGWQIKRYNATYTTALSNFSNKAQNFTSHLNAVVRTPNRYGLDDYPYLVNVTANMLKESGNINCTACFAPFNSSGKCPEPAVNLVGSKLITDGQKSNFTLSLVNWETTTYGILCADIQVLCFSQSVSRLSTKQNNNICADTINPRIYFDGISNHSRYYTNIHTIVPVRVNYTDGYLYAVNQTIWACSSPTNCTTLKTGYFANFTGYVSLEIQQNLTLGVSYPEGMYKARAEAWDGHTAQIIDDYVIQDISTPLKAAVKIEDAIEITSPDAEYITLEKNFDRYNFDVALKDKDAEKVTFNVKSNGDLTYIPEGTYETGGYMGWFVDFKNKKWIDFEGENVDNVVATKISNKEYSVEVNMLPKKFTPMEETITFNSVGDLNYAKSEIFFNISSPFYIQAKDKITNLSINNITAKIYTYPNTLIQQKSSTSGTIYFNVTSGTYYVNVSGSLGSASYVTNVSANKTLSLGLLYTPYLTLENSLYLFIRDEQTNELIDDRNVTIDLINYQNISTTYTTATGSTFQNGFAAGQYEINYKATNYTARSYYTTIAGSDTQTITLYLLSNLDSTHAYKLFEILDDSASPLPNSTLKLQRYMIDDNAWRTMEMSRANDEGKGFVFVELYDATYRFVIDYGGITRKTTAETKLDTRDLFISVDLLSTGLAGFYASNGVTTDLTYSNVTKVWTFDFNAASINEVDAARFLVLQKTPTTETTICNTTLVATSGGITCNLTSVWDDGGEFYGHGYVTTDDSREHLIMLESIKTKQDYLRYGLNGVLLSLIIIGTLAFLGLYNPTIAIGMALLGLVLTTMAGLLYLSTTWVIGMIVVGLIFIFTMST